MYPESDDKLLNRDKLNLLSKIVGETNSGIVLISSYMNDPYFMKYMLEEFNNYGILFIGTIKKHQYD